MVSPGYIYTTAYGVRLVLTWDALVFFAGVYQAVIIRNIHTLVISIPGGGVFFFKSHTSAVTNGAVRRIDYLWFADSDLV